MARDVRCSIRFGDIVHKHGGGVAVVQVPDQGSHMCSILEINGTPGDYSFPDAPKSIICTWSRILRVIGSHRDLPKNYKELLNPCRKCIVLGAMHWDRGVYFFEPEEYELFRQGKWSQFNIGCKQLVDEIFGTYCEDEAGEDASSYRVLVHTDQHWNTWTSFGAMTAREAENVIVGLENKYKIPEEIRRGVYRTGPDSISKFELYRGYAKIKERHFCRGQGEGSGNDWPSPA